MELCAEMAGQMIGKDTLDACREGNREAFRQLVEAYQDRIYSLALVHFAGDEAAAWDTAQEVFLKVHSAIQTFRGDAKLATWLYRIAVNCCLDRRRRERGHIAMEDLPDEPRSPDSPETEFLNAQWNRAVAAAVASLRPRLRWPVLLRYFEGLSYAEIAAVLGCSEGTVASRLNRGHQILSRKLAHLRRDFTRER